MVEFYATIALSILNIVLPYVITRRDRKTLREDELARAWNTASWASAVYFFGPLCLPAHFWVTRRTLRGLAMGGLWMVGVFALESLMTWLLDQTVATR